MAQDDTRLGTPPEGRSRPDPHGNRDKPPRMAMGLLIGLIGICTLIGALVLWRYGSIPGSA